MSVGDYADPSPVNANAIPAHRGPTPPLLEADLFKRSNNPLRGWELRHFRLTPASLTYSKLGEIRGILPIAEINEVRRGADPMIFTLHMKSRTMTLKAHSASKRNAWFKRIKECVDDAASAAREKSDELFLAGIGDEESPDSFGADEYSSKEELLEILGLGSTLRADAERFVLATRVRFAIKGEGRPLQAIALLVSRRPLDGGTLEAPPNLDDFDKKPHALETVFFYDVDGRDCQLGVEVRNLVSAPSTRNVLRFPFSLAELRIKCKCQD
jgi:hypothetical protein